MIRRLLGALSAIGLLWFACFVLVYVLPSDPARVVAGPHATAADLARIRVALGLDASFPERLGRAVAALLHGDLGHSTSYDRDVLPLILERLPPTLELALAGLAIGLAIGVPLGVRAAARPDRIVERAAIALTVVAFAIPAFLLGHALRLGLATEPRLTFGIGLPIGGYRPLDPTYLLLPALTLGLGIAAVYARMTRTLVEDELRNPYVRTARAKGLPDRDIRVRHALRNASPPIMARIGLDMGAFLGGVAIVEVVFDRPGVGRLAVDAIRTGDVSLIMGTVVVAGAAIIAVNVAVDVVNERLDPRLRDRPAQ